MADDNGNGRVTIAILATKLDHNTSELGRVADNLDALRGELVSMGSRLTVLETQRAADCKAAGELSTRVDRIDIREKRWDAFLGVLATVLGAVGVGSWLKP